MTNAVRSTKKKQRWDFRVHENSDAIVAEAATLTGVTKTDFVIASAVERATNVLASERMTRINADAAERFIAWLDEPSKTLPQMKRLRDAEPFDT